MKNFWALPAFLRLVLASQHSFAVFDDLLAFPQYEVIIAETVLSEDAANDAVAALASRDRIPKTAEHTPSEPHSAHESSIHLPHHEHTYSEAGIHNEDGILSYENMLLHNRRYLCSIPRIPEAEAPKNKTKITPDEEERELARATDRGWELLKTMEGSCLYFYSGWWSYSFCYGKEVRQFHQLPPGRNVPVYPPIEDKQVDSYVLGRYESGRKSLDGEQDGGATSTDVGGAGRERGVARLETKGEVRYLVQKLAGGTTCDLTAKERKIEVQFRCQPNQIDKIALIKETTTCQYLMIIDTPRLCNDVAFLPPQESKPHPIACTPVLPAASIPSYLAALESQAVDEDERLAEKIEAEIADALNLMETGSVPVNKKAAKAQVVGDIEIGAHRFLPRGGKRLEKGVIAGGGKEKLLATIAKSGGWLASEKDMKSVGIKNAKDVDGVKKEVERVAEGKSWRLDVVETPRGKELRGVIVDENDEDKETSEKNGGTGSDDEEKDDAAQEGSEETYKDEL